MSAVLAWIKANVIIVIFFVVMIAALVALPIVAGSMNEGVQKILKERVDQVSKLEKLEKTSVDLPGVGSQSLLVNQRLLDRYIDVTDRAREDARLVLEMALEHNRHGRDVLMPQLFPKPLPSRLEVLRQEFYRVLMTAYDDLLARVDAGAPPTLEEMQEEIARRRAQFMAETLQKEEGDALSPEEEAELRDALTQARLRAYSDQADTLRLYASMAELNLPVWDQANQPTLAEQFEWQWQYWIIEDVLEALAAANAQSPSVKVAPVKRVVDITVYGNEALAGDASGGGTPAPPPTAQPTADYQRSFTGRTSNSLFDVRDVRLTVVVDSVRMPALLDALAAQNFITILDVKMSPADQFEDAAAGYIYGASPVSRVELLLETLWLREWTTEFMPEELKAAMGIPVAPPVPTDG